MSNQIDMVSIRPDSVHPDATLDSKAPSSFSEKRSGNPSVPESDDDLSSRSSSACSAPEREAQRPRTVSDEEPFDHKEWASKAWEAFVFSLKRCPIRLGNLKQERETFISRYTKRSIEGTAMKWLKFHTTYIFAYAWGQTELPPPPYPKGEEGEITLSPSAGVSLRVGIIGGQLGRALRSVMSRGRSGNAACRNCAYDIMQSKLGMPPAPEGFINDTLKAHQAALTKEVAPEEVSQYDRFVLGRVKAQIGKIVQSLFSKVSFRHRDPIPSMRACYEAGMASGGALCEMSMNFMMRRDILPSDSVLHAMYEAKPGIIKEIRFRDFDPLVRSFQDEIDLLWLSRLDRPLKAVPVPILEPLKVRTITKGQAAEYYRTIELQKMMHTALRQCPMFEYIGHPIDESSWSKCFGTLADLANDEFYVSGDYKAATDNLNPELSAWAWECICHYVQTRWVGEKKPLIDTPYYLLGRKALVSHLLHYGDVDCPYMDTEENGIDIFNQHWGQLMGSPMSFPILCIVNAAASLTALNQDFSWDYPMKVNGDDIAFVANNESYATWKEVTKICGLEFSLGKNYISREFMIMNSELRLPPSGGVTWDEIYSKDPSVEDSTFICRPADWTLVGFLNQSICRHLIKKGIDAGEQKDVHWTDLQSLSYEVLRGIPDRDQWKVLSCFLKEHQSVLTEIPSMCNMWFPTALGGAGVAIPSGKTLPDLCRNYRPDVLEKQQRQAAYLACNDSARLWRPHRTHQINGLVGEIVRDTLKISNGQIEPRVVQKTLHREQHTLLGGKTLLGYLITGIGAEAPVLFEEELQRKLREKEERKELRAKEQKMGIYRPRRSIGQIRQDEARVARITHLKEARFLRHDYINHMKSALKSPLEPMRLDNIAGYQEHLTMLSYIETMVETPTGRSIDHVKRYVPQEEVRGLLRI